MDEQKVDWKKLGFLTLLIIWLSGPAVLTYQSYTWLKNGGWPPLTLWDGLHYISYHPYPHAEWIGVQKIVDLLMMCPLSISLLVIASLVTCIFWMFEGPFEA